MAKQGTQNQRPISRRTFLRLSAVFTAGAGLAACGGEPPAPVAVPTVAPTEPPVAADPTAAPAEPTAAPAADAAPTTAPETGGAPTSYSEAPMLAALVAAGSLPPVDQRLPKNPMVVDGLEGPGNYGGTLRRAYNGVSDYFGPNKVQQIGLVWYKEDLSLRPDLAESWEVSEDAKTWTFKIREGLKWSDGNDLTTDEFKWYYDNVLTNEALENQSNSGRGGYSTGKDRTLMTAEFPDKLTAVFTFAHPNPLFIYQVTRGQPFVPSEHMKQFHADFADAAELDAKVKAAGFETWEQLFDDRNRPLIDNRPSTGTWVPANTFGDQLFEMTRNPYFSQVDSAGNQLPYIDKVTHLIFESPDALSSRVLAGEVDYQARHMSIGNFTLFKEGEASGDYKVVLGVTAGHIAFQPNHTTKEPKLREFFQARDVRLALSHSINRSEMNELLFNGTAEPRQYSPLKASPQYYEKLSTSNIEFDVDKGNQLLDAAGYDKKDGEGFRLWKDGSGTLSFVIEGTALPGSTDEDAVQTIVKYFATVGVKAAYKPVERALYTQHFNANEIEAAFWGGDRTLLPLVPQQNIFLGTTLDRPWADAWGIWRNNPDDPNGEQPPADHWINNIWALWDELVTLADESARDQKFFELLDIWAEEMPMIGVLGELPQPIIVKNGLKGVRPGIPIDDPTKDEQIANNQTFFWDDPSQHGG